MIGLLLVGGTAAADPVVGHSHLVNILHVAAEILERGAAYLAQRHTHFLRVVREVLLPIVPAFRQGHGHMLLLLLVVVVVLLRRQRVLGQLWRQPVYLLLFRRSIVRFAWKQRRRGQIVAEDGCTPHRHGELVRHRLICEVGLLVPGHAGLMDAV